ncbi:unnamed protein product [Mucor hiemalis]
MLPFIVCPATCELCGNWLPQHQTSCPRNGVHPSQWSHSFIEPDNSLVTSEEYVPVTEQELPSPPTTDLYL